MSGDALFNAGAPERRKGGALPRGVESRILSALDAAWASEAGLDVKRMARSQFCDEDTIVRNLTYLQSRGQNVTCADGLWRYLPGVERLYTERGAKAFSLAGMD